MITFSLQSGSNGNSIYVETSDASFLVDCGLTGKKAQERMAVHDRHPKNLTAVIVSHDHRDHTCGVGVISRRFEVPIHASVGTARSMPKKGCGHIPKLHEFTAGDTLVFGETRVETIPTPHDGTDGVAFVVEGDGVRLGVFTDLGHPFPGLLEAIASTDACYIESNYDVAMLDNGGYPEILKERIRGDGGHISNDEAADLAREAAKGRLKRYILSHLSGENNAPDVALETAREKCPEDLILHLAGRYSTSEVFEI